MHFLESVFKTLSKKCIWLESFYLKEETEHKAYRAFSHDVTVAILVFQNNETAAMLVYQTSPMGVELFSYVNTFFCFSNFACVPATWVKTLYSSVAHNNQSISRS